MKFIKIICLTFILLSSLYVSLIFIFPLFHINYQFPLFYNRIPDPYATWNFYLFLDFIPFIGIVISYLIYITYAITSIYIPYKLFSRKFLWEYAPYEQIHKILLILNLPFMFLLGFELFSSQVLHSSLQYGPMLVVLTLFVWVFWLKISKSILGKIWAVVAILFAFYGIWTMVAESIPQIHPKVYGAFSLNDPKGIYKINYDGDYWFTYYINKPICWQKNVPGGLEKTCKDNLVKQGNTVIIEAPTDLQKYLDKQVQVKGTFVPALPPIYPDNPYREFCTVKPKKVCQKSKGQGIWFFSPLKLNFITFTKSVKK